MKKAVERIELDAAMLEELEDVAIMTNDELLAKYPTPPTGVSGPLLDGKLAALAASVPLRLLPPLLVYAGMLQQITIDQLHGLMFEQLSAEAEAIVKA
jgi:hypothetical protein